MILQIIFGVLLLCYLYMRWKHRRLHKLSRKLNNDLLTLPIIGHMYLFIGNSEDCMKTLNYFGRKALDNGGVAALWLGTKLFTVVADPVIAEYLMKTCLEKDDLTKLTQSFIGNGSIFAPVFIWRPRRKAITPNFNIRKFKNFVNIFAQQSHILINNLKASQGNDSVSLLKYITAYAMDSICETTFGVKMRIQSSSEHPFPKAFQSNCQMYVKQVFAPYIYNTLLYKLTPGYAAFMKNNDLMREFVKRLIRSTRKHEHEKENITNTQFCGMDNNNTESFLDVMIKTSKQGLSDLEILEELLVLILAGTDSSATGAAFVAMMLSRHPEVQDKVYQELQDVFGDSDRPVTANDLTRMKYLDAVIKESIRLYPAVPVTVRKVDEDVRVPSGITLVKDSSFAVHNWAINRNSEFWGDDAEEFRPERFFDAPPKHPAAFASFSIGPRNCIGYKYAMMSMSTVTIYLLRNFKLLPPQSAHIKNVGISEYSEKDNPLRIKFEIMIKDADNFKVRLEPRIKSNSYKF